jgi:hypothetical protein
VLEILSAPECSMAYFEAGIIPRPCGLRFAQGE